MERIRSMLGERPLAIWLMLAFLLIKLLGLFGPLWSYHLQIFGVRYSTETAYYLILNAGAVAFMALLFGHALVELWRRSSSGFILSALIAAVYLWRTLLLDAFSSVTSTVLDESGNVSTAFLDVYGHRLYQFLLLALTTMPIWSKASWRYVRKSGTSIQSTDRE